MQGLTPVEEMLISAVLPIMTLYRLPHGQYGYSGHIINLPQDVASLADKLPRTPADLLKIIHYIAKKGWQHNFISNFKYTLVQARPTLL